MSLYALLGILVAGLGFYLAHRLFHYGKGETL